MSIPVPRPRRYRWVGSRLADHLAPAALQVESGQVVLAVCLEQFIAAPAAPSPKAPPSRVRESRSVLVRSGGCDGAAPL